jgi:GDP-L-fucose synthase
MKILITGANGLVGRAVVSILNDKKYNVASPSSKECDFENFAATLAYLLINFNVLKCAHLCNVKNVVSCLSTCIFPDDTTYPIDESMLHDGPPHFSNDSYAYAKRMLQIHSHAYNEQYNTNFKCIIPTNIYGPHDNFSLEDGHVIPSLIHKCYLAKTKDKDFIVRGTGKPLRQFIFSKDLAELTVWVLESYHEKDSIILSVDEKEEISIGEVAHEIAKNFNYEHRMVFDSSFSDGQYKKTASNAKLRKYLPHYEFTTIQEGIQKSVEWFLKNYKSCRK